MPADSASEKIAELGVTFAEVWSWLGNNHQQLTFLLGILGLLLTWYVSIWSPQPSHDDEEMLQRQSQALEEIAEALRKLEPPEQLGPANGDSSTPEAGLSDTDNIA